MHLVHASEEIMQVPHDVLIGTGEEDPQKVGFPGSDPMDGQGFLHILKINELGHLAIGITGDIDECPTAVGKLVQTMNRHDRKELAESPMIQQRLKDGKIAEQLVG